MWLMVKTESSLDVGPNVEINTLWFQNKYEKYI